MLVHHEEAKHILLPPCNYVDIGSGERYASTEAQQCLGGEKTININNFSCELFFPLEGPGSHRGGNPRKMGKITKFPSPVRPPKMGKIAPKNYKNCIFGVILPLFGGNFPHFRGSDRGGEFCSVSPFSRISATVASRVL